MLSREQLAEWFPGGDVEVYPPTALPDDVTDGGLRILLTEVGLPESFIGVVELGAPRNKIRTIGESFERVGEKAPEGAEDLLHLGLSGSRMLGVDRHSGHVLEADEDFGVRPLNSSLESFLRVLGFVSVEVEEFWSGDGDDVLKFADDLRARTMELLPTVDPAVMPAAGPAWSRLLDNVSEALT